MAPFQVVHVINDNHPMPAWVRQKLQAHGVDLKIAICWSKEDLALHAADADLVWVYGGRRLLVGDNLSVLKRCGAILRTGSGTDNIDVQRATELGIIVANTPHVIADQVADQAISMLFSLVRRVTQHDRYVHRGQWEFRLALPGRRFHGATLGLVGFGRIPRLLVHKLAGFDMEYLAYDPYVPADVVADHGVASVSLADLLSQADYVSLHCPLTAQTYHLIGEAELRLMKPTAFIVNTARGSVIDERALIQALQEGWIAGAGLDVLEQEPIRLDNPLLALDNVIITPHYAGYSDRYPEDNYEASVEAILDMATGHWPRSVANPQVSPRWVHLAPAIHHDAEQVFRRPL